MKYDIITIGDSSEDVFVKPAEMKIVYTPAVASGKVISLELGEKIPIEDVAYEIGGSACNLAVGFSRMGLKTGILSMVGDDSPAINITERLDNEGVSLEWLITDAQIKTNFSVILNTEDGERTILVYHGIDYTKMKLNAKMKSRWIYLAPVGQTADRLIDSLSSQEAAGRFQLAWNPGSYQIKTGVSKFRALIKRTAVLFLNREEAVKFMDYPVRSQDEEIMRKYHLLGAGIVVITNGRHGVKAFDGRNYYRVGIIKDAKRIDATGAGDSFAAGFLGEVVSKDNAESITPEVVSRALVGGIINSTSVVGYVGAQHGLLKKEEMETMYRQYQDIVPEVYE